MQTRFALCFLHVKGGVKITTYEINGRNARFQYRVSTAIMAIIIRPPAFALPVHLAMTRKNGYM